MFMVSALSDLSTKGSERIRLAHRNAAWDWRSLGGGKAASRLAVPENQAVIPHGVPRTQPIREPLCEGGPGASGSWGSSLAYLAFESAIVV
jgi:hypothetical protein